ncbi:hypothetical protein ACFLS1_13030 [Verrucomicrobiota bacterium]
MKNCIAAIVVFLMLAVCMIHADTVTFQEGVNGYSGTEDTYIGHGGYNRSRDTQSYGSTPSTLIELWHWNPG